MISCSVKSVVLDILVSQRDFLLSGRIVLSLLGLPRINFSPLVQRKKGPFLLHTSQ